MKTKKKKKKKNLKTKAIFLFPLYLNPKIQSKGTKCQGSYHYKLYIDYGLLQKLWLKTLPLPHIKHLEKRSDFPAISN